jgi:predicted Zn-dependent protease
LASYKFDEIGNPAEKKYLIQNGILKAGLGSLESQIRSGLSGVANATF